jgi:uroporphyrinogen decarboxylase
MAPSRERVAAVLALDLADHPPVSAWGHTYDQEWGVDTLVEATVSAARRFDFDFVKLQIRASCFAEAFGARWRPSGSAAAEPELEMAGGATVDDWRRIAEGAVDNEPLDLQVEVLRRVASELGPQTPCLQTVFSPGMVAWFLAGRDTRLLMQLVRAEPGLMAAGMARIAEVLASFTLGSVAVGAAGVFYAINPLADSSLIGAEEYGRSFLPHDRVAIEPASAGWFNMLHLCGPRIDTGLIESLPTDCVNWSTHDKGNPGLTWVRDRFRRAVVGGLHRRSPIADGSPEQVRAQARAALEDTGGRGHLLTPGCSVSPWPAAAAANLEELVRSAREPAAPSGQGR